MQRRAFLASSGLLLAGCATTRGPVSLAAAPTACLPKVLLDERRIIRTVAGLRPFRDAGFVVRRDALGDTALVHNYGHGGGGITLSWGSAHLACNLGLPGHAGSVAVLGAGVMGLSTARLAQERGFAATIYTEHLPPETTSNIAGGQIAPASVYSDGYQSDAWMAQFAEAMAYSWRRFQLLVGEDYGVRWVPTYEGGNGPASDFMAPYMPGLEDVTGPANPFGDRRVRRYHTMYVETGRYLRQLMEDFLEAGGRFVVRRFGSLEEVAALPERVVFNCTGLGARDLVGDEEMVAKRGQLAILLPQPEIDYAYTLGAAYMFTRPDGILLGGTFERDEWDPVATPQGIATIMRRNRALQPTACS